MKHNKLTRWAALILAAALTLSLTACGGAGGSSSAGSASASQSAPASAITLTDQAGRQVELDAPADTLVSCYYVTTYATMALGISDRVVGLEKKADTRPIYAMAAPDLLEKEQVGTMKELDLEAVAALEPDLVVMPKKLMDYAAPLEELGIPVLVVNPESHEALTGMLELLGQACGVEDRAKELTDYYEEQIARIRLHLQKAPDGFTSIYADLKAGRRTEVDVINGAVVEAGHRHNIPVPTHEFVVELVHAMEGRA